MAKILCENYLCVYYEKEGCVLNEISLNHSGVCTLGIHVYMENEDFEKLRKQQLAHIINNHKNIFNVK